MLHRYIMYGSVRLNFHLSEHSSVLKAFISLMNAGLQLGDHLIIDVRLR